MTLDSLPDVDTSGLCLVKTLSTALTCWPYRNTALRDGARTSTRTSSVAKGRTASIHCRPAPPRQTEALSSRTSRGGAGEKAREVRARPRRHRLPRRDRLAPAGSPGQGAAGPRRRGHRRIDAGDIDAGETSAHRIEGEADPLLVVTEECLARRGCGPARAIVTPDAPPAIAARGSAFASHAGAEGAGADPRRNGDDYPMTSLSCHPVPSPVVRLLRWACRFPRRRSTDPRAGFLSACYLAASSSNLPG